MSFSHDSSVLWMRRHYRKHKLMSDIMGLFSSLDEKIVPSIRHSDTRYLEFDNGCRLIGATANPCAAKGMSISHVVIEDVDRQSRDWHDIMQMVAPCFSYQRHARMIVIEKDVDASQSFVHK